MIKKIKYPGIRENQASSMVEMMITTAIFSMMILAAYLINTAGANSYDVNQTKVNVQQETRKAMDFIYYELRQSSASVIADVPEDGQWHNSISFQTPASVLNGTIVWSSNPISYSLSNGSLTRTQSENSRIIANHIETMIFRRNGDTPSIVDIEIVASDISPRGLPLESRTDFKVHLRND